MVSDMPVGLTVTENGCPPVGGGPSPMSRIAVPLRVAVPPTMVELVIQATMVTCWDRPRRLIPVNWTSTSPFDVLAFCAPTPKIPPASSTPLSLADAGKTPAAAAVVVVSPTSPGVEWIWMFPLRRVPPSGASQFGSGPPAKVGGGGAGVVVQKRILNTSELAPESELSST